MSLTIKYCDIELKNTICKDMITKHTLPILLINKLTLLRSS